MTAEGAACGWSDYEHVCKRADCSRNSPCVAAFSTRHAKSEFTKLVPVMPTKNMVWKYQEALNELVGILGMADIPNEVKFFKTGQFLRYCDEFSWQVEQALPRSEPDQNAA